MPESDIDIEKKRLRKAAMERRADAKAATGPLAGDLLAAQFTEALPLAAGIVVAGYWPMREEISPVPLLKQLHQEGKRVVLPAVAEKGEPLRFRHWEPDLKLDSGPYGTLHPPTPMGEARPDVVLVPLLAFDDDGYRLGYGAEILRPHPVGAARRGNRACGRHRVRIAAHPAAAPQRHRRTA